MKKTLIALLVPVILFSHAFAQEKAGKKDTLQHVTLYTCSMHPDVKMDKPGKCPQCGMDLILSKKEEMKKSVIKNYSCPLHTDVVSSKPGKCSKCGKKLILSKEEMKKEVMKTYNCPMHPDVASAKPGKCPKCGMDLKEKNK